MQRIVILHKMTSVYLFIYAINSFINDNGELDENVIYYDNMEDCIIDLKSGIIKCCYMDAIHAYSAMKKDKSLYLSNDKVREENFIIAFRKEDIKLCSLVDKKIENLYNSGEFVKISNKWFGTDMFPK